MEQVCPPQDCCGCRACRDVCPKAAITMVKAADGFFYPEIDPDLCIDCGLCRKVCPEWEIFPGVAHDTKLYSAYSRDRQVRHDGSSGGTFQEVARYWLEAHPGNAAVYGAAFAEGFKLRHTYITRIDDIAPLLKSKYIESDTDGAFRKIRGQLKDGMQVMFCGTPCQCAALRKYLFNTDTSGLLVVDILCHGVPSQDLFDKSMAAFEKKHRCRVTKFDFRARPAKRVNTDHYFSYCYEKNGTKGCKTGLPGWKFPYYYNYCCYNSFRRSCYDCRYATPHRCGDITLGDFWRLDTVDDVADFDKGYSMVFANTPRGKEILHALKAGMMLKEYPLDTAVALNPTFTRGTVKTAINQQSVADLSTLPFDRYQKKYMIVRKDVISKALRLAGRIIKRLT